MSIFEDTAPRAPRRRPLRVAILGCSGSVGSQTLDVCRHHRDKAQVVALAVHSSIAPLAAAAREFKPAYIAVANEKCQHDALLADLPEGCKVTFGAKAVSALAELDEVDCVVNAVVGEAGIYAGYAALKAGKTLAYANKESIVVGGDLLMPLVRPGQLVPVDSEHSAIFQCLAGERLSELSKLWLTCSGGPFFGMTREELAHVSVADALAHPTWSMGAKISIDSATLMNKGLEILEAHHLFETSIDDIHVLVHRQSRIHSMVEFIDGSVKGQLGPSDMRIPIQYALSYPERWQTVATPVMWGTCDPLTCEEADEKTFGCLALAKEAGRVGGTQPCVMNAANEVANEAFRLDKIGFLDIERIVSSVMETIPRETVESIEQLSEIDTHARALAQACVLKG